MTADAGEDSHSGLLALEIGIPAVIGAHDDMDALRDGMEIVLDAKRGVIYERPLALARAEE